MKKIYTLVLFAITFFNGNAQIVNIPDLNFKYKLLSANSYNYIASQTISASGNPSTSDKIDTNNDGEIQVSEALAIKYLNLSGGVNITNLTGIESFTNLQVLKSTGCQATSINVNSLTNLIRLYCNNMLLTSLNVSSLTNLQILDCNDNQIPSLNVSGLTNLQSLDCSDNQIPSLNVSDLINLQSLDCSYNQIPSLNLSGLTNLQILNCGSNQLPSLNVNGLTSLLDLKCNFNQFTSLDVIDLTNLQSLICGANQLTSLNLNGLPNLQSLNCTNNQLSSLDVSAFPNLQVLTCWSNQLTNLNVSGLTNLQQLTCNSNQITTLDVSGLTNLQTLICKHNQLPSLDVSGLTNLQTLDCSYNQLITLFAKNGRNESININSNPTLLYICADEVQISNIQTEINQNSYINCNVNSYCSFTPGGVYYSIEGNNRIDSNANGCDANDSIFPNLKCVITSGSSTGSFISNSIGSYNFPIQAGNHTITPVLENPTYFNVSPSSTAISFPSQTSPYNQDFCITANGIINDLETSIIPIEVTRPGFDAHYKIIYKNKGNQIANGTLSFSFDDTVMDLVSSFPIVDGSGTNSLNWNFTDLNPFETREIDLLLNINSPMETPPVNGGDELGFAVIILPIENDEAPIDNHSQIKVIVVNSYDPNDKTCLEGNTISPEMVGEYVHYVIRFENTGTFAAENVVIADVIDTSKFEISTLIPQSSSHDFFTRINGNKVEFIFENINLPFDDENNDGYVAFKIKTKPNLVVGDEFTNTASIYFDYNFPIITNTTSTTVEEPLSNQDFDFETNFSLYPNPANEVLNIKVKSEMEVKSVSIYNTLGQIIMTTIQTENGEINVSNLQSGNYFIKVFTDKGSSSAKFIKL
jgi:Leucine-rich repeat (LRR) protein